ncbi:hypothetical protein ABW20_dc0106920 [Dactylellina cionopaga]|nr:hypothetical protein ABW20_dc0106920 [Dactylellina cionopaga]
MALIQRQFGKLLKRSADDANVAQIIADVKDYDERLDRLVEDIKKYQDSISQLLLHQNAISVQLWEIYKVIPPERVPLDKGRLTRIEEWNTATDEMKKELTAQVMEASKILGHTVSVKGSMKPVKKVLERRENSKLDYERYTSNYESAKKKGGRSEREVGVLAKAERQLDQATKAYNDLDAHVKEYVPPIMDAVSNFIPYLLYAVEGMVSTFIGQKYRFIHEFAQRHQLDNYENFEQEWKTDFMEVKEVTEQLKILQEGKAVHKPMEQPRPLTESRRPSAAGLLALGRRQSSKSEEAAGLPVEQRRPSTALIGRRQSSKTGEDIGPPVTRIKSNETALPPAYSEVDSAPASRPMSRQQSSDSKSSAPRPPVSRASSNSLWPKPSDGSVRPQAPKIQSSTSVKSFRTDPTPADNPPAYSNVLASNPSISALASAAAAAAKKKPPPPIPGKPKPQLPKPRDVYMVALFNFEAQGEGDLPLTEGERIRVIQKTESVEDWWEGEVTLASGKIKKGFFPANYCQPE